MKREGFPHQGLSGARRGKDVFATLSTKVLQVLNATASGGAPPRQIIPPEKQTELKKIFLSIFEK